MTPTEIREARGSVLGWFVDDSELPRDIAVALTRLIEAARAYADLLENGQEREFENFQYYAFQPGRYLVVRVGESP